MYYFVFVEAKHFTCSLWDVQGGTEVNGKTRSFHSTDDYHF